MELFKNGSDRVLFGHATENWGDRIVDDLQVSHYRAFKVSAIEKILLPKDKLISLELETLQ